MGAELGVLHCDNHLLAVSKPACTPSVPDSSGDASMFDLARAWIESTYGKPGRAYLGVVHRLDRPVSGTLVFARTSKGAARLTAAFAAREVQKVYWGILPGVPDTAHGRLCQWLWKDRQANRVHVVGQEDEGAREAITDWRVLAQAGSTTLVEFKPLTGRPHQLRLAAVALAGPLLGDLRYGARGPLPDRSVALHARSLEVPHPTRGGRLKFEVPPPALETWSYPACMEAREVGAQVVPC